MNENEQKVGSIADQKSKIRERYKGITPDELDVIPALPQEDISIRSAGFFGRLYRHFPVERGQHYF